MPHGIQIFRQSDNMPLVSWCKNNLSSGHLKSALEDIFNNKKHQLNQKLSFFIIHDLKIFILVMDNVIYGVITDIKESNRKVQILLSKIHNEFLKSYKDDIQMIISPFAFRSFEKKIEKIVKDFQKINIEEINLELFQVAHIMNQNMNDLIKRGDGLEKLINISQQLASDSKKFSIQAKRLNWMVTIRRQASKIIFVLIIFFILYLLFGRPSNV